MAGSDAAATGADDADVEELVAALADAAADLAAARERVADLGEDDARRVASAHREVTDLLDRYEDRATDWDDAAGYIEFRDDLASTIEDLPDDLPERSAFEAVDERLKTAGLTETLSASDFEAARRDLEPARRYVEALDAREDARAAHREARGRVRDRRDAVVDRIADREAVQAHADADLDADLDPLRDPVDAYARAVREDFRAFRADASARQFVEWHADAADRAFVDYRDPPPALSDHLREHPVGEEPVSTVLEYADYSRSKLSHYVAEPAAFLASAGANRQYLAGLDADPLTVGWPPPEGAVLERRARALSSVIRPFAREETVARLREVRLLPRETDYERLRRAAVARADLDAEDRERLARGAVADELGALRERRDTLEAALDEHGSA